jgi:BirA family biotin operon repressor/biotin-[acetyl-CoA-carboxylase] ligase
MASALAVVEAIELAAAGLEVGIKWPNDVQIAGRKVCGILIETDSEYAVVGIGLNVNGTLADDAELAARATTLAADVGAHVAREAVAAALLRRLDGLYAELQAGGKEAQMAVREAWRVRLVTLGRQVTLRQGDREVSGIAEDVNDNGALLLRRDDGSMQTVTWGDVEC